MTKKSANNNRFHNTLPTVTNKIADFKSHLKYTTLTIYIK